MARTVFGDGFVIFCNPGSCRFNTVAGKNRTVKILRTVNFGVTDKIDSTRKLGFVFIDKEIGDGNFPVLTDRKINLAVRKGYVGAFFGIILCIIVPFCLFTVLVHRTFDFIFGIGAKNEHENIGEGTGF